MQNAIGTGQYLERASWISSSDEALVPLLPAVLLLSLVIHQDSRCGYCMRF